MRSSSTGADPAYFPVSVRSCSPAASSIRRQPASRCAPSTTRPTSRSSSAGTTCGPRRRGKNGPEIAVPADRGRRRAKPAAKPAAERRRRRLGRSGAAEPPSRLPKAESATASGERKKRRRRCRGCRRASSPTRWRFSFRSTLPTTIRKPYFIFGDKGNPVNLWFADLAKKRPALYLGARQRQPRSARAARARPREPLRQGRMAVVFKRRAAQRRASSASRKAASCRSPSRSGTARSRERGNKRGLTTWWTVYLSPAEKPSPAGHDGGVGGARVSCSSSRSSAGRGVAGATVRPAAT